jgi:predicted aminopeptidase
MSRRTRKRRPKHWHRPEPTAPEQKPMTEAEWDRLRQRFAHMKGRAIEVGYVGYGSIVDAANPEELREKAESVIAEQTKKLPKN